ncbi:hypothetical protein AAHE18_13G210900 [Arachis hypogaea]
MNISRQRPLKRPFAHPSISSIPKKPLTLTWTPYSTSPFKAPPKFLLPALDVSFFFLCHSRSCSCNYHGIQWLSRQFTHDSFSFLVCLYCFYIFSFLPRCCGKKF